MARPQCDQTRIPIPQTVDVVPRDWPGGTVGFERRADLVSGIKAGNSRQRQQHRGGDARQRRSMPGDKTLAGIVVAQKAEDQRARRPDRFVKRGPQPARYLAVAVERILPGPLTEFFRPIVDSVEPVGAVVVVASR